LQYRLKILTDGQKDVPHKSAKAFDLNFDEPIEQKSEQAVE
jgi:hypothetical protein